ncbi:hypothetical protein GMAR_ORF99 [Golden Marseillevirus]|uniref:hypothetical protein n=1 Tax=Golden Marseillevirus TaxID=1720526 RepID=UPI000877A969|nr:hypothetical protein GMAR_ORF99 [Golden Marseillevirus]ALX27473.1 hypothetical protein GMAR_ORF99 [Golden Marseillevirus]
MLSGSGIVRGSNNTFVGAGTKSTKEEISDSVAIGFGAVVEDNNELSVSNSIRSVRVKGLARREATGSEMLSFDASTGLLHTIKYPEKSTMLPLLEKSDILELDVRKKNGRATVSLDDVSKFGEIAVRDSEGKTVGVDQSSLVFHILFSLQKMRNNRRGELAREEVEQLKQAFHEFRDSNYQNLSGITKSQEALLAKILQVADSCKGLQELEQKHSRLSSFVETMKQKNEEMSLTLGDVAANEKRLKRVEKICRATEALLTPYYETEQQVQNHECQIQEIFEEAKKDREKFLRFAPVIREHQGCIEDLSSLVTEQDQQIKELKDIVEDQK